MRRFADRTDAGRRLGALLRERTWRDPLVLGLPRGGVVVAVEVARALGCPCDTYVAGKLPAPGNEEYAIGAVDEDGDVLWGEGVDILLSPSARDALVARTRDEVRRRVDAYRDHPLPPLWAPAEPGGACGARRSRGGRDVICVDDGLATGLTARVAAVGLRARAPASLVVAVPVAAPSAVQALRPCCDEVVCLLAPPHLSAIGAWYRDFGQVSDAEVRACLNR